MKKLVAIARETSNPASFDRQTGSTSSDSIAIARPSEDDGPINILLVDDEPKNLTVLETILDDPAYRLVKAQSADQALLALLADEFALLILDIRMPGTTGIELAQLIKQRKKTADIPIIFLTAYYNEDQHVLEGYGAGAVDYLHKPVNAEILRSKVAVFARLYRMQRAVRQSNSALLAEVIERKRAQQRMMELNDTLEQRVNERSRALSANAALLQAIADNASVGLVSVDCQRRYTFANSAYCRIFNLRSSIVGRRVQDVLAPEDAEENTRWMDRAFAGERATSEMARSSVDGSSGHSGHYMCVCEPELDLAGNIIGAVIVVLDITERKRSEEQIKLLLREVNHRSKNMLSVVSAIARQTKAPTQAEYVKRFSARVHALAASHDLLSSKQWKGVTISDLIGAQLAHFDELIGRRIVIEGPDVRLSSAGAQVIGMIVHELATNAVKHGALSNQTGHVVLNWSINGTSGGERFTIGWTERDGPEVVRPTQRGYGSTVITSMAELNLDGIVSLDYAPAGLCWRLDCPAKFVQEMETLATEWNKSPVADHMSRP